MNNNTNNNEILSLFNKLVEIEPDHQNIINKYEKIVLNSGDLDLLIFFVRNIKGIDIDIYIKKIEEIIPTDINSLVELKNLIKEEKINADQIINNVLNANFKVKNGHIFNQFLFDAIEYVNDDTRLMILNYFIVENIGIGIEKIHNDYPELVKNYLYEEIDKKIRAKTREKIHGAKRRKNT